VSCESLSYSSLSSISGAAAKLSSQRMTFREEQSTGTPKCWVEDAVSRTRMSMIRDPRYQD
jgi:hypothetical protein